MNIVLLTQDNSFIIGQVAWVLGKIMNGIFNLISLIGLPNIGLAIFLFTIVVNLLLLPLTIKQQKFSKLNNKMQPEIQAIQKKYKDKKDNDSMMAQNQEIQAVYAKYGVSPTGSCLQLLIQMPILFALYRVIYAVPAYVGKVREAFYPLVNEIINNKEAVEFIQGFKSSAMYAKKFTSEAFVNGDSNFVQNTVIDCLNKASTVDFRSIGESFPSLSYSVTTTMDRLAEFNNFFGLNIADSPQNIINQSRAIGAWGMVIGAIMIPVLSAVTQLISIKLMPQPENPSNGDDSMASSMKAMNTIMPIFSAWFCFTLPSGMGLYWIASAVVRTILMIVINKQIDKMDLDDIIKKNAVKSEKKIEQMKKQQELMSNYANMSTKNISAKANLNKESTTDFREVKPSNNSSSNNSGKSSSGGSSMRDKANMVKNYNEKNNK